jgi:hypothetical protein
VYDPLPVFRSAEDGLEHMLIRPSLALPSSDDILRRIARQLGGDTRPSEAGLRVRAIVSRFAGSRPTLAALTSGPLRLIWDDYQNGEQQQGRYKISERRVLWTAECFARLDPNANDDWVSEMCRRDILHSGMCLKCDYCGGLELYRWGDLGWTDQKCRRCRSPLSIDPIHADCWAPMFALNPILVEALKNGALEEIALMVVLAARRARETLAYGTDWLGVQRNGVEVDVVGAVDGLMVVGEAKSVTAVTRRQLDGLVAIARKIQARQLILATSQAVWDPATTTMVQATETDHNGFQVELITRVVDQAKSLISD